VDGRLASASGFALAVASPIWGILGDRFGRKPMLLRSMVGGALFCGVDLLRAKPDELIVLRFLQGATSGTVAAATALVAAETPRLRVGWALGVVTSAIALGGAIGPVVGGLAGDLFGLRLVVSRRRCGAVSRDHSGGPDRARESAGPDVGSSLSTLAVINQKPGLDRALAVLIGSQGLISTVNAATQQLVVLRLLELLSTGVSAVSGFGFGLSGLASSAAAIGYTRVTARLGYVRTAAVGRRPGGCRSGRARHRSVGGPWS